MVPSSSDNRQPGVTGGYKVLERFPLTEEGWAQAWRAIAATDIASADRVAQAVAAREAAAQHTAQPRCDMVPVLIVTTSEVPGHRVTHVHGNVFDLIARARSDHRTPATDPANPISQATPR
jgi:hypothetical protein